MRNFPISNENLSEISYLPAQKKNTVINRLSHSATKEPPDVKRMRWNRGVRKG